MCKICHVTLLGIYLLKVSFSKKSATLVLLKIDCAELLKDCEPQSAICKFSAVGDVGRGFVCACKHVVVLVQSYKSYVVYPHCFAYACACGSEVGRNGSDCYAVAVYNTL